VFARGQLQNHDGTPHDDHTVQLSGVTWEDYERLLEIRGDKSAPRLTYCEGILDIMSPSRSHEVIKSLIGRLVEAYCFENAIRFETLGPWTLKEKKINAALNPTNVTFLEATHAIDPT